MAVRFVRFQIYIKTRLKIIFNHFQHSFLIPFIFTTMPPKKAKKKNKYDEEFEQQEKTSLWMKALQQNDEQQEGDAEEVYGKEKSAFDFDFTNSNYLPEDKPIQRRDKLADLTDEEKEQLKKIQQKEKQEKERKQKIKNEKRKERQKELEIKKEKERIEKQKELEEEKKVQEQIKKNKTKSNAWVIPVFLLLFIVGMGFLQYQTELHAKLAKFKLSDEENLYEVLEADEGATDVQIKNKYKKLVLKYHPDRNPNCSNCQQIFDKIMKAWEVLGSPDKRKAYDQNRGVISELKSSSITLTPDNYNYLVEESKNLWVVQVFDSTDGYSRYFSQFWEQIIDEYSDIVKFGRIDIWHQSNMVSYIPYRFQVFPGIYIIDKGYSQLCTFDFERPLLSVRRCIEKHYEDYTIQTKSSLEYKSNKPTVFLHPKLKSSLRTKAISKTYENEILFYYEESEQSSKRNAKALIFSSSEELVNKMEFLFQDNTKKYFNLYNKFLQSFIPQKQSICQFLNHCEEQKCYLVLNETVLQQTQLPFSELSEYFYPIIVLKEKEILEKQIERIKNITDLYENFQIGVYEGGKIDLGYANEVQDLQPEAGEFTELKCRRQNWWTWGKKQFHELLQFFGTAER